MTVQLSAKQRHNGLVYTENYIGNELGMCHNKGYNVYRYGKKKAFDRVPRERLWNTLNQEEYRITQ